MAKVYDKKNTYSGKTAKPTKGTNVRKSKHVEELAKRAGSKEPRKLQPLKKESEYNKVDTSKLQPIPKYEPKKVDTSKLQPIPKYNPKKSDTSRKKKPY